MSHIKPAIVLTLILTVITGLVYPLVVTGLAQLILPWRANGSLIERDGNVIGSDLIGQKFTAPRYFHPRPSAAATGYDAMSSGGSNLGPTNRDLIARVDSFAKTLRAEHSTMPIPVDMVTASASGLDPHITPANAEFQASRVARERGLSMAAVLELVREHTEDRQLGLLGEARVNVLRLNLALDEHQRR